MSRRLFEPEPVALARMPLRPADLPGAGLGLLAEGILLASPGLSAADGSEPRAERALRSYEIRSRTRPTPHGVFSAVAAARFGAVHAEGPGGAGLAAPSLGAAHRTVTAPSPLWLAAVYDRMLDVPSVLAGLTLTTNAMVRTVDGRFEVDHAPPGGRLARHSVRATEVSRWLLAACTGSRSAASVIAELTERAASGDEGFGGSTAARRAAENAVRELIRSGLLLTGLTPDGPPAAALRRLARHAPRNRDGLVLRRVRNLLAQADTMTPGDPGRPALLRRVGRLMRDPAPPPRLLVADTFADARIELPAYLGEQAAAAAGVLWRTARTRSPLADYHRRFVAAYGTQRLVPLLEVLDAANGLGPPGADDGLGTSIEPGAEQSCLLARLATGAEGGRARGRDDSEPEVEGESGGPCGGSDGEIVLTDALVERLAGSSPELPPRSAEIHVRVVRAESGELRLAVCPYSGSQQAGSASGRYAAALKWPRHPDDGPSDGTGPMIAEIVCRPADGAATALTAPAGLAPYRIALDVPPRPGDLGPADLYLASAGDRLVVWAPRHGRRVLPVVGHRAAPALLPPAARLLRLLGQAGTRPWRTWSWGPCEALPHTPRVRYREVLLAPARWNLPAEVLEAARRPQEFAARLAAWRATARPAPPGTVLLDEADRLLPVDLDEAQDREVLRSRVCHGVRAVLEPLGGPAADPAVVRGPDGGHLLELVVSLRSTLPPAPVRLDPRCAARPCGAVSGTAPGAGRLSLAVQVPEHRQDAVLRHLAAEAPRCFWLRYSSPGFGPHLRIRFSGERAELDREVRPAAERWADRMAGLGLAGAARWEPYVPETERYGGSAGLLAAEEVFVADSALVLDALTLLGPSVPGPAVPDPSLPGPAPSGLALPWPADGILLAAAGAVSVARVLAAGAPAAVGRAPLDATGRRRREALRGRFRSGPGGYAVPAGLARQWRARERALAAYRAALLDGGRRAARPGYACHAPGAEEVASLCASDLIHLHVNRLLGADPAVERLVRSLAADRLHRPS
ncbi:MULTISPECIES: lantibiotic dehydratase [unclassified Streptomyces]|uniref:lantibiotic dehydratase n=1 Tax=unclassified Streptomyces TaxID=2593676 RepID=UPI0004CAAAF2|nr:lantibiotic dehydratase [Streptomyces sp. NRRL F-2747]